MIKVFSLSSLNAPGRIISTLNINSYHSLTKFLQPANLTTYTILSLFSLAFRLLSPQLDHPYLPHYKSPTALSHMHHLTCGISSLLHPSTSFCSLSSWFTSSCAYHLISHLLRSHHLSLPLPSTPDSKLISLSQILSSMVTLIPSGLTSRILTCTELKGHCLF